MDYNELNASTKILGYENKDRGAMIRYEIRKIFPGVGDLIQTSEGVVVVYRKENNADKNFNHRTFLTHVIIKKLDDFFFRQGFYKIAHIPRPLGSIKEEEEESTIYEYFPGETGFPWLKKNTDYSSHRIKLEEWHNFVKKFLKAGIDMNFDVKNPSNKMLSDNIVHQFYKKFGMTYELNAIWKRIDFGEESIHVNLEGLERFLIDNKEVLIKNLRIERYEMLIKGVEYLKFGKKGTKGSVIGKLDALLGDYRFGSLKHYTSRGHGDQERLVGSVEGLEGSLGDS